MAWQIGQGFRDTIKPKGGWGCLLSQTDIHDTKANYLGNNTAVAWQIALLARLKREKWNTTSQRIKEAVLYALKL